MGRYSKIFGLSGLGLVVVGLVLWVIKFEFDKTVAVITIAGLFLLLFTLFANFNTFRDLIGRRTTRYGMGSIITIVLVLAIIVFVEAISTRHHIRRDLTENKRHSLSDQSLKVLKGLNVEVETLAFFSKNHAERAPYERLLRLYKYRSPLFKYTMIDPEMEPTLTKQYGVKLYGTTVVKSGKNQVKIEEAGEEKLTNAILKVIRSEQKTIYMLKGHGELAMDDESEAGFSRARESMEDESYEVKELVLLREEEVPRDAAAVMIAGPKVLPSVQELELLSGYIERGGSLLFMIDPGGAPGIDDFLLKYGVVLKNDLVVDSMSRKSGADFRIPIVTEYAKHPITENFGVASFFPVARSVNVDQEKVPEKGKVQVLASSGPKSWSETDFEGLKMGKAAFDKDQDTMGPVPLAAVVTIGEGKVPDPRKTEREPVAKIVVFGDSDFASNSRLDVWGNRDLFLNTVRWLAGEEDLIAIRPRSEDSNPLFLKTSQARMLFILPVVVFPAGVMVAGVFIFTRRKKSR